MHPFDIDSWRDALDHDPEFAIAARCWNTRVKLRFGAAAVIVRIADGRIAGVRSDATPFNEWQIEIAAPQEEWHRLLEPVPRPFYHDVFAASVHHGFTIGGDLESFYAYYPAVRRMFELMRVGRG